MSTIFKNLRNLSILTIIVPLFFFVSKNISAIESNNISSEELTVQALADCHFSDELKKVVYTSCLDWEYRSLCFTIQNNQHFDINKYLNLLSSEISDVGDWYEVDLNKAQTAIIKRYLRKYNSTLMNVIYNSPQTSVVGYLFARDWYWGNGFIGVVVRKSNELLIVPQPFNRDIHFGNEQLDNMY